METKKFCEECGANLGEGDRFCPQCGTAPAPPEEATRRFCEKCGTPLGEGEKFCEECGAPADPAATPAPAEPSPPPLAAGADRPVSAGPATTRRASLGAIIGVVIVLLLVLGGGSFLASRIFSSLPWDGDADKTTLKLDEQSVRLGETATVPLWLVEAVGITGLRLTLSYDPSSLEPAGAATPGSIAPGASIEVTPAKSGVLEIVVRDETGISGTGALVKIPFKIIGRSGVKRTLRLSLKNATALSGNEPGIRLIDGAVVIGKP